MKKVGAILKKVNAPPAMVNSVPVAVGKDSELDKMIVAEGVKLLQQELVSQDAKIAGWAEHTQQMAAATTALQNAEAARTAAHDEKRSELFFAKEQLKVAVQASKDMDASKKAAAKALATSQDAAEAAERAANDAHEAHAACQMLYTRNSTDSWAKEEPAEGSPGKSPPAKATPSPTPRQTRASLSGIRATNKCMQNCQTRPATCAEMGAEYTAIGWMCDRCDRKMKPGVGEPFQRCDACDLDYCNECR